MAKLIQTNFVYVAGWNRGGATRQTGSYLGRKPATVATLRKFLQKNASDTGTTIQIESITITGSHGTNWLA